jgi:hypothetical protein
MSEIRALLLKKPRVFCFVAAILLQGWGAVRPLYAFERLDSGLLRSVVRIETSPDAAGLNETGSGFLVTTAAANDLSGKVLLVTNKHMIGDWNPADKNIQNFHPWINVFFY